ncbi:MAG: response regulator transcription factor [Chthoniobacterales bacterium]
MKKSLTILLAEDHMMVREGFRTLLELEPDFSIVGEARDGRTAVALARQLQPDILLLDLAMPRMNGLEAARQIRLAQPACKILILSAHSDDAYVEQALACGVSGFLLKQSSASLLTHAIREVALGRTYFTPSIAKRFRSHQTSLPGKLKKKLTTLTSREREVLQLIAEGKTNKATALELRIGIKTVEKHREHLMAKLDIHDTAGLTRYAISSGIIENSVQITII